MFDSVCDSIGSLDLKGKVKVVEFPWLVDRVGVVTGAIAVTGSRFGFQPNSSRTFGWKPNLHGRCQHHLLSRNVKLCGLAKVYRLGCR